MKKIKYLLLIIPILVSTIMVNASGSVTPSTNNITIAKGKSTTFTVNANNVAGKVNVKSSNTNIVTINADTHFFDTSLNDTTWTITVTGVSGGEADIEIELADVATFDSEELTGTKKVHVKVEDTQTEVPPKSEPSGETIKDVPKTALNTSEIIYIAAGIILIAALFILYYYKKERKEK